LLVVVVVVTTLSLDDDLGFSAVEGPSAPAAFT